MSKKKTITFVVILLILTNILTFGITNMATIKYKDRVIIPKTEYQQLSAAYENMPRL